MKIKGLLTQYKENDIVRNFYDSDLEKCSESFQILEVIGDDEFLVRNLKTGEEKLMDGGGIRLLSLKKQEKVLEVLSVTTENILNKVDELYKQLELFEMCNNELGMIPKSFNMKSWKYDLQSLKDKIDETQNYYRLFSKLTSSLSHFLSRALL